MKWDAWVKAKFEKVIRWRKDLHDYQANIAIPFLRDNPFSALFIGLGMGKTTCGWTLISDIYEDELVGSEGKTLIIGPMRVATQTWPNEKLEWGHFAHLNHSLIHVSDDNPRVKAAGKAARLKARLDGLSANEVNSAAGKAETAEKEKMRIECAHDSATVHIVSVDWIVWLVEHYQQKWPYTTVLIDESSGFKDHTSERFKALRNVRMHVRKNGTRLINRLHEFTATPAAESYIGFFSQVFLMDAGERLGVHVTKYQNKYFTKNAWTRKFAPREGAQEEILAKIADICLVMKAEDYLDLTEPEIIRRPIVLEPREMDLYETMQTESIVTLPDGSEVEAETAAALSQKLLQMASGVLYETYLESDAESFDMKKVKKVHHLHDQKIEELKQIIEEANGEPILVAYWWKSSLDRLQKAFPKAVVMDRDGKAVKPWNAKKIPLLLMHPMSGGHGLNLQHGGHLMVIFDMFHSLELFLQLVGRLARQGQKHPVLVYLLTAVGTLDETVADALKRKEDAQDKMFAMLRRLIRKIRKQREVAAVDDEL